MRVNATMVGGEGATAPGPARISLGATTSELHWSGGPVSSTVSKIRPVSTKGARSMSARAVSAGEARRTLLSLIERVNEDHDAVEIVSPRGNAVLMSADDFSAWQETAYLLRSPANARRLLDADEQARSGSTETLGVGRYG